MKKILHLNSYYIDTHLYSKIYKKLSASFTQIVYIPIKEDRNEDNKMAIHNTNLIYSKQIKKLDSIFHFNKINRLTKDVEGKLVLQKIDLVHAHNLYTDGAIALNLKKKYGLKYVVSVRMTDIALQYRLMRHRRALGREILAQADHIIFISPLYQSRMFGMMKSSFTTLLNSKTSVLPNGIDDAWLETALNLLSYRKGDRFNLLYLGQIVKRKNLDKILNVIEALNENGNKISLTVIGGEYASEKDYFQQMVQRMDALTWVSYKGVIRDHTLLMKEMAHCHSLIMPSVNELFGLVFIEAISQNRPVIYPINEGITPYLQDKAVGVAVNPNSEDSIENGILQLIENYSTYENIAPFAQEFDWSTITGRYTDIYNSLLNE